LTSIWYQKYFVSFFSKNFSTCVGPTMIIAPGHPPCSSSLTRG
jgi:hypothetical protein